MEHLSSEDLTPHYQDPIEVFPWMTNAYLKKLLEEYTPESMSVRFMNRAQLLALFRASIESDLGA